MWVLHRHSNRLCTTIPDETRKTTAIRTSAKRLCPNFRKSCPFAVTFCMVLTMGRSCTAMIWIGRKASAARPTSCLQKALLIIKPGLMTKTPRKNSSKSPCCCGKLSLYVRVWWMSLPALKPLSLKPCALCWCVLPAEEQSRSYPLIK